MITHCVICKEKHNRKAPAKYCWDCMAKLNKENNRRSHAKLYEKTKKSN